MSTIKYLSKILLLNRSEMINDLIFVVTPVLSITVLMFSLRSVFEDNFNQNLKNQKN